VNAYRECRWWGHQCPSVSSCPATATIAHREPAKKSLEDREILGQDCGNLSADQLSSQAHQGRRGYSGVTLGVGPIGAAHGFARLDATGEHVGGSRAIQVARDQSWFTWDFRGGGQATCRGKSRGDSWDRYIFCIAFMDTSRLCGTQSLLSCWPFVGRFHILAYQAKSATVQLSCCRSCSVRAPCACLPTCSVVQDLEKKSSLMYAKG